MRLATLDPAHPRVAESLQSLGSIERRLGGSTRRCPCTAARSSCARRSTDGRPRGGQRRNSLALA